MKVNLAKKRILQLLVKRNDYQLFNFSRVKDAVQDPIEPGKYMKVKQDHSTHIIHDVLNSDTPETLDKDISESFDYVDMQTDIFKKDLEFKKEKVNEMKSYIE